MSKPKRPAATPNRRRQVQMIIRLDEDEAAGWREEAALSDLPVATVVRHTMAERIKRRRNRES